MLERDAHSGQAGSYEIHSLYFDDYQDTCVRENDAGISRRFKYRIRFYDDDASTLHLERKEKLNGLCHKDGCRLTREQYDWILEGRVEEVLWQTQEPLLKRFCTDCMTRLFRPKAIVDYIRVAYVEPITNVRITLDKYISVSDAAEQFLGGNYIRYPVLETGQHVLEAKFDAILPGYIRNIVSDGQLVQTAFSKYYLGRRTLENMGK